MNPVPSFISRIMRTTRFKSAASAARHFHQLLGSFFYSQSNAEQRRFEAREQARKCRVQEARNLACHKRSMIGHGKNTLAGIPQAA